MQTCGCCPLYRCSSIPLALRGEIEVLSWRYAVLPVGQGWAGPCSQHPPLQSINLRLCPKVSGNYFFFQPCFCLPQPVEMSESLLAQCTRFYSNLVPGRRAAGSPGPAGQARRARELFCASAGAGEQVCAEHAE